MEEKIVVDIGSGKTKVYVIKEDGSIGNLFAKRIRFKETYNPETGLDKEQKKILFETMQEIKKIADGKSINIFATSIFRIMPKEMLDAFKTEFKKETGVDFNVLSQETENLLTTLPVKDVKLADPYLAVCIGNGSTEMAIFHNGKEQESFTIEHARADLMKEFPQLRDDSCDVSPEVLRAFVRGKFTFPQTKCKHMIVIGGNGLSHAKECGFKMEENVVFKDKAIPVRSDFKNLIEETDKLIKNNHNSLPSDDIEMIRAHCIITGCLMEAVNAENCFMTDLNLIDGIAKSLEKPKQPTTENSRTKN